MGTNHVALPQLSSQQILRFKSKVNQQGADDCWPWMAAIVAGGYGGFKINGSMLRAHRIAYFIEHGSDPASLYVCHSCDNPPCCNPTHLFLGTNRDNQIDARDKGRLNPAKGDSHFSRKFPERVARGLKCGYYSKPNSYVNCRGEAHKGAKLTEAQVREIRTLYAQGYDTMLELGQFYGVAASVICQIVNRKRWKHI